MNKMNEEDKNHFKRSWVKSLVENGTLSVDEIVSGYKNRLKCDPGWKTIGDEVIWVVEEMLNGEI